MPADARATESSSIYREHAWTYVGGPQIHGRVPKIIMKMGTRGPHFHGVPKIL